MQEKQQFIFRFRALLILVVFGITLLPRQTLHNFISNHKHIKYTGHPGKTQLSAETFSCKADDVFIQQTFDFTESYNVEDKPVVFEQNNSSFIASCERSTVATAFLRGPPADL